MLLLGKNESDPLFLQVKEAQASVLEPHLGRSGFRNSGRRVVEGQRMMQAASDIFLGWVRNPKGIDGVARDFYVRQLWDWKTSVDLDAISPPGSSCTGRLAAGRSHGRMHAPVTGSRSRHISARATSSTVPSPTSPWHTRT